MAKTILIISQVCVPDPAAVGQYIADAAEALAGYGFRVTVLTADRGYDDPSQKFGRCETRNGVDYERLPFSSLGKASLKQRLVGQLSFCVQAFFRGIFSQRWDAVLVTTSPPMGGILGWAISRVRGIPLKYWVMDINPDQALILGKVERSSPMARLLEWGNRRVLARASDVIVLDRYMERVMRKKLPTSESKFHAIPPWPMENHLERIEHEDNAFRRDHGLADHFVFMYSGNHSIAHPLSTVVDAAFRLKDDVRPRFVFIGGGLGKEEIEQRLAEERVDGIISLPYQPLDSIKYSLSAADVHLVAMGESMTGIVHPCKYYAAMALGKPIVLIGPADCHIADVLAEYDCGWRIDHGDVAGAEALFRKLLDMPAEELQRKGKAGREVVKNSLSYERLIKEFIAAIDTEPRPA